MHANYIYDQSDPRVAQEGALEEAGRAEQHIITEAAPNELKLGRGAYSDESWPSARRWRRGVFVRRRLRNTS